MAARKRTRQSETSNPNSVLIGFLIFFVLTTLGMGGWAYSLLDKQRKAEETASKAAADKTAAETKASYYQGMNYEARLAQGDPMLREDKSGEIEAWKAFRDILEVANDGKVQVKDDLRYNKFDNYQTERDNYLKYVEKAVADLGWDAGTGIYKESYSALVSSLRNRVKALETASAQLQKENGALREQFASLDRRYGKERQELLAKIEQWGKINNEAVLTQTEAMKQEIEMNKQLQSDLSALQEGTSKEKGILEARIRQLQERLATFSGDKGDGVGKGLPGLTAQQPQHALLLDISMGKTLWDRPVAKLTRIDERDRTAYLDKGEMDGVRPQLTFNVFGAGWNGKADGPFKGTVEVIRVEPRSSVARITSLYDKNGNEILLNDPSPSRMLREGGNPMKEGDLLFHLAWGAHVVVAGVIDFSGSEVTTAAAQQNELQQFLRVLESQGVKVDAYLDLRDGQIKGALTSKTQYLIRGRQLASVGKADDELTKAVNGQLEALKKEALDHGWFVISPDNFLNAIGYRRPQSKLALDVSGLRPTVPSAVAGEQSVGKGTGLTTTELAGSWAGKITGGGLLKLKFKADGGCTWQMSVGTETFTGFSPVSRAGADYALVIQNRPVTARLIGAGTGLQISGDLEAILTRE